ncbi:MAG: bifunctional folylpolyglutamate synthase/dihydrofolate synthase [Desulfobacteraceae bacterium]|nr:bifunctional folylpolyglutamate synthase/dihydrofolate synthase [Desulfobacteraceae bacterium]
MGKIAYQDCLDKIYGLGRFGIKLELDTIHNILKTLNNPQKNYYTIHIAGTNGKGSTATYIESILRKAGFKTGIYTSPHLVKFNERICVNGEQISDEKVVEAYEAVHAADLWKRKATFFEINTAMAFYHFSREKVEWAIIETGMGGRFDATNVISPQISVITNLSIEHSDYLGHTIKALAREKGGIIKQNTPVVTGVNQPSGLGVIKEIAKNNTAPIFEFKHDFSIRKNPKKATYLYRGINQTCKAIVKPLPGDHQKENLSLALATCELVFDRFKGTDLRYNLSPTLIKEGLAAVKWPGRLEVIMEKPLVILDGAHNLKAAKVLGKYLSSNLAGKNLTLVLGILDDKPYEEMLNNLVPHAQKIIITKAKIDRSLETQILKEAVKKITNKKIEVIEDVNMAVTHAISACSDDDAICIAGSLYVAGEAKEKFNVDFI